MAIDDVGITIENVRIRVRRRVELAHLVRQLFLLLLERDRFVEDRQALVEDRAAREAQAVLRQVADLEPLLAIDLTGVQALDAGDDLEQS